MSEQQESILHDLYIHQALIEPGMTWDAVPSKVRMLRTALEALIYLVRNTPDRTIARIWA